MSSSRLGALLLATNAAALFLGVSHCFLYNRRPTDGAAFVVGMTPATTARGLTLVSEVDAGNFIGATHEAHQGLTTASSTTSSATLLAAAAVMAFGLRAAAGSKVFAAARADGRRVRLQAATSDKGALAEADEDEGNDEFLDDEEDTGDLLGYDDDDDDDLYDSDEEDNRVEATWRGRFLPGSPWKFRRVLWQIRGRSYRDALILLEFLPWRHCKPVLTGLQSAAANAQNQFNMDKSRLYVSRAWCGKGPIMKRMRPHAKGQPHMYVKRTAHVTIRVAEMEDEELDDILVA